MTGRSGNSGRERAQTSASQNPHLGPPFSPGLCRRSSWSVEFRILMVKRNGTPDLPPPQLGSSLLSGVANSNLVHLAAMSEPGWVLRVRGPQGAPAQLQLPKGGATTVGEIAEQAGKAMHVARNRQVPGVLVIRCVAVFFVCPGCAAARCGASQNNV